jgi:hypothetical protein
MKMTAELIAEKTLHFTSQSLVEAELRQNGRVIETSRGEDVFDYNGMLFPDSIVTATGRRAVHTYQPDLAAYGGVPGEPGEVETLEGLTLWLHNNAILSQGELQTYFMLRITVDGRTLPVSLLLTRVHWVGKGLFCIYLDSLSGLFGMDEAIAV